MSHVDELAALLRIHLSGLPHDCAPRIRVQHGSGHNLAICELWIDRRDATPTLWSGAHAAQKPPTPAKVCDLPPGVGRPMRMVEQAIKKAGMTFATTDLGLRAAWRRLESENPFPEEPDSFELAILVPDSRRGAGPASRRGPAMTPAG